MTTSILHSTFASNKSLSGLPLRLIAGIIFTAHGSQKLFAWFGGYGLDGTGQWMESIGLSPGFLMAMLAGGAEFFGGLLLILGLLTRPTSIVLAITMLVAIFSVHINNGLFMTSNGYEFALSLLAITLAMVFQGAGRFSLDNVISKKINQAG
jgi:putative oxidoreductase